MAILDNPSSSGAPIPYLRFDLNNAQSRKAWKRLCAALIVSGVDIVMHMVGNRPGKRRIPHRDLQAPHTHHIERIASRGEQEGTMRRDRKLLWDVMAWKCGLGLVDEMGMGDRKGIVALLCIPFG